MRWTTRLRGRRRSDGGRRQGHRASGRARGGGRASGPEVRACSRQEVRASKSACSTGRTRCVEHVSRARRRGDEAANSNTISSCSPLTLARLPTNSSPALLSGPLLTSLQAILHVAWRGRYRGRAGRRRPRRRRARHRTSVCQRTGALLVPPSVSSRQHHALEVPPGAALELYSSL